MADEWLESVRVYMGVRCLRVESEGHGGMRCQTTIPAFGGSPPIDFHV